MISITLQLSVAYRNRLSHFAAVYTYMYTSKIYSQQLLYIIVYSIHVQCIHAFGPGAPCCPDGPFLPFCPLLPGDPGVPAGPGTPMRP